MDIKCRKTTCEYNIKFTCTAKELKIGENHECKTYKKSDKPVLNTTGKIFFEKVEYAPHIHCLNKQLYCKAPCIFQNCDKECIANGILVNEKMEYPYCMTFLMRDRINKCIPKIKTQRKAIKQQNTKPKKVIQDINNKKSL